jgi:hypothetical protein
MAHPKNIKCFYRQWDREQDFPIDADEGTSQEPHDVEFWHYCKEHSVSDIASNVEPSPSPGMSGQKHIYTALTRHPATIELLHCHICKYTLFKPVL